MKPNVLTLTSALFLPVSLAHAQDSIVGTWKLKSFQTVFCDGSAPRWPFGQSPTGYTIFAADGRMMTIVEAEGGKPATTDDERAALYRTSFSYTGAYRIDGERRTTKVDLSSNPAWVGTEQVRTIRLSGDVLETGTHWAAGAAAGAPQSRGAFTWERVR